MDRADIAAAPRGAVSALVGFALLAAAALCLPARESTPGVQATLAAVSLSLAGCGIFLIVKRRAVSTANLCLVIGSAALGFLLIEAALALAGVAPLKRIVWRVPALAPWWIVEGEHGGRIDGRKYAGPWRINDAGFPDTDEFDASSAALAARRVLLLGDSFAFGAGASAPDAIFPQLLDRALDAAADTTVWNLSIPGTGQSSQLQLLREFLPRMNPHVVLCTLYRNDFAENLLPLDRFYVYQDGNWVDRYDGSELGRLQSLSPEQAYRRAFAPQSPREFLKISRAASAFAALVRRAVPARTAPAGAGHGTGPRYVATIMRFREIQKACEAAGAKLVVLLVPDRADLMWSSKEFTDSIRVIGDLGLPAIDVRQELVEADYAPPPDTHWNDHGHAAVAAAAARDLEILWPRQNDPAPMP